MENAARTDGLLRRLRWTFFGSSRGGRTAAVLMSFIASCQRLKVNPWAYLHDVLGRIAPRQLDPHRRITLTRQALAQAGGPAWVGQTRTLFRIPSAHHHNTSLPGILCTVKYFVRLLPRAARKNPFFRLGHNTSIRRKVGQAPFSIRSFANFPISIKAARLLGF